MFITVKNTSTNNTVKSVTVYDDNAEKMFSLPNWTAKLIALLPLDYELIPHYVTQDGEAKIYHTREF